MKKDRSTAILVVIFFVGLSVLLYPTVSDFWNRKTQANVIVGYETAMKEVSTEDYTLFTQAATDYNTALRDVYEPLIHYDQLSGYDQLLNIAGDGIMGYIHIPRIKVSLPIYHGTSQEVLAAAVGHIPGTSLPIGGAGTHAALSAHRGLPSAKLFTDLNKLQTGDTFTINVLDQVLTYEVDQVLIVLPEVSEPLAIDPERDYCTLVTCTPYGVNSHRLLVRGRRIATEVGIEPVRVPADAVQIEPVIVAPAVAFPMLLLLLIWLLVHYRRPRDPR